MQTVWNWMQPPETEIDYRGKYQQTNLHWTSLIYITMLLPRFVYFFYNLRYMFLIGYISFHHIWDRKCTKWPEAWMYKIVQIKFKTMYKVVGI